MNYDKIMIGFYCFFLQGLVDILLIVRISVDINLVKFAVTFRFLHHNADRHPKGGQYLPGRGF